MALPGAAAGVEALLLRNAAIVDACVLTLTLPLLRRAASAEAGAAGRAAA